MDRVNVDGTRAIVEAAADAGVGRVVVTSSAATIGEAAGTIGAEHTAHTGDYLSPYARSKHRGEEVAFATAADLGVDLVAVNPSSVQGPGRAGGSAKLFLHAIRSERPWLYETDLSVVDIADCTAGHVAAAERGRSGERYLLSGATIKVSDAVAMVGEALGRPVRPRWISEGVLRTVGRPAARLVARVRPDAGICPALIDTLLHGHRFDASKSERDLGLEYRSIRNTLERTVSWFRAEGLIG
jgi:dihydroflavonol-4-reductase